MVSKENRLTKTEISNAMENGKRFRNDLFDLKLLKSESLSKIAVIISKKVSKKAVIRNKIRRLIKQWFLEHSNDFEPKMYVFIAKNENIRDLNTANLHELVKLTLNN